MDILIINEVNEVVSGFGLYLLYVMNDICREIYVKIG